MPAATPKRGRGRPRKDSGKADGPSKVVKSHTPTRRSTRGTQPPRSQQGDVEVQATEDEADNHPSPAVDASSDNDGAWEVERQIILDGRQELRNRCEELEAALARTLEESAAELQDATDVINANQDKIEELQESLNNSEDHVDRLRLEKIALLRRAQEAEEREAELNGRIEILQRGQPGSSTGQSSGEPRPVHNQASRRDEDDTAAPGSSQPASGATVAPRETAEPVSRTPWSEEDVLLFVELIAEFSSRHRRAQWSTLAKEWNERYPGRPRRTELQLKDKARNHKTYILMNRLVLPPYFDRVSIDAKARQKIIAAGLNPYRREEDVDERFRPINVYLAR